MPELLRLEYTCTPADLEEAQSVHLRKQVGGGSKWKTAAISYLTLGLVLLAGIWRIQREIPKADQPYFFGAVFVLFVGLSLWQKRKRPESTLLTEVHLSESNVQIICGGSRSTSPWSSFSECLESPNLFVVVDKSKTLLLMLPKRAFPSHESQVWFRDFIDKKLQEKHVHMGSVVTPVLPNEQVSLTFQLGYRDYLNRTLASWFTWGVILGIWILVGGSVLSAPPVPNPVNSASKVFFVFIVPFMLLMGVMIIVIFSVQAWRAHKAFLIPQQASLSETSICLSSTDGTTTQAWTDYVNYKETPRSFIIWRGRQAWLLLPKRAFTSHDDLQRCRSILAKNLRQSRWFLG